MSKISYCLSPQISYHNKILLPQYITNASLMEKEIFKLINYLRINPEKYLNEFNKYFQKEELNKILGELNKLETKLLPFNTKKEISNAGIDYLEYLIEKTTDKYYFNIYNVDKTCFNLRARLSKYGQRNGKIFESVIINSSCPEEIVNKLIKDDKARNMILSPYMKYIAITSGYLPKLNNICTIIDIVQDFIAYKDITNNINNYNSIQIINTIDNDENDNKDHIQVYKLDDKINNKYCSKTLKSKNKKKNIIINIDNNNNNYNNNNFNFNQNNNDIDNLENNEQIKNIFDKNKYFYYNISRNNYNKKFNSTISGNSKLISPLATYKSDAYLIYNQSHSNLQKSFSTMKRVNSDTFTNHLCDLTNKTHITLAGTNYRNSNDNSNYNKNIINLNNNNIIKNDNQYFNKIEVNLKNKKDKNRVGTVKIKEKEKLEIIHSINELKNQLFEGKEKEKIKEKENEEKNKNEENNIANNLIKEKKEENTVSTDNSGNKERNNEVENKLRLTNFTLKNAVFKKINNNVSIDNKDIKDNKDKKDKKDNRENTNRDIRKKDSSNDTKNNDNNNYNISFDNNSYSFFSKDNNQQNNRLINDNDNSSIEQINNTLNINKKQNSFFSHDTDINNILYQKEKNANPKNLKVNIRNNKNDKDTINRNNKSKIECEKFTFKNKNNNNNNNSNKNEEISINKTENLDEYNDEDEFDFDSEDLYYHKNKKEIKQLIRLYNKERYEQKIKNNQFNSNTLKDINTIDIINNNDINIDNDKNIDNDNKNIDNDKNSDNNKNSENNNHSDGTNNKKSTATFFYINKDIIKDKDKDIDNKGEKKIKVYRKQRINNSNSHNKTFIINKNNIYINSSHQYFKSQNYYSPESALNTESAENADNNYYKIDNNNYNKNKNNNNINLYNKNNQNNNINNNINSISINYSNINYNSYYDKKRIYSYKANRSKLFKNRSHMNVLTEDNYKNLEEKQYLSDKNINDTEANTIKSHKYTIKRVTNLNDNKESNLINDINNDFADEIIKINGYKNNNKKELKEITINYLYDNRKNYNSNKETYIYKKNKVIPEKKNSVNFYNKCLNKKIIEIKPKPKYNISINTKTISQINQNGSKKKYILPYVNYTENNETIKGIKI